VRVLLMAFLLALAPARLAAQEPELAGAAEQARRAWNAHDAKALVAESVAQPDLYWRNNVAGSLELLEAMRAEGVERIIFSSTAATYGEPETVPIRPDAPTHPTNPY